MLMSDKDAANVVLWAEKLANKYELGINTVVNAFVRANSELNDIEAVKIFVESEMKDLKN